MNLLLLLIIIYTIYLYLMAVHTYFLQGSCIQYDMISDYCILLYLYLMNKAFLLLNDLFSLIILIFL